MAKKPCEFFVARSDQPPGSIPIDAGYRPVRPGESINFSVQPPLAADRGCRMTAFINGEPAVPGHDYGPVHVVGIGAKGTLEIRAREEDPAGTVEIRVECADCGPTPFSIVLPGGPYKPRHGRDEPPEKPPLKDPHNQGR